MGSPLSVIAGNHTDLPEMDTYSCPMVWQDWQPLSQGQRPQWSMPMTVGPLVDGCKKLIRKENIELVSAGFRIHLIWILTMKGTCCIRFRYGIWFGYALYRSYRRICHVTSGSEFGWERKWEMVSGQYPNTFLPVLNIGAGVLRPCRLRKGAKISKEKYQKAFIALIGVSDLFTLFI